MKDTKNTKGTMRRIILTSSVFVTFVAFVPFVYAAGSIDLVFQSPRAI